MPLSGQQEPLHGDLKLGPGPLRASSGEVPGPDLEAPYVFGFLQNRQPRTGTVRPEQCKKADTVCCISRFL